MEDFTTKYLKDALAQGYAAISLNSHVCFNGNTIPITLPLKRYPARFLMIEALLTNDNYQSVVKPLSQDLDPLTARTLLASLIVLSENFIAGTPCYIFDDNNTYTRRHILGIQKYHEPLRKSCSLLHSDVLLGGGLSEFEVKEFERIRLKLSVILGMTPISQHNPQAVEGSCL